MPDKLQSIVPPVCIELHIPNNSPVVFDSWLEVKEFAESHHKKQQSTLHEQARKLRLEARLKQRSFNRQQLRDERRLKDLCTYCGAPSVISPDGRVRYACSYHLRSNRKSQRKRLGFKAWRKGGLGRKPVVL